MGALRVNATDVLATTACTHNHARRRAPGTEAPGEKTHSAVKGATTVFTTGGGFHLPVRASDFGA